jgi:sensor histidine kinase regulating citrate/malate metabolism
LDVCSVPGSFEQYAPGIFPSVRSVGLYLVIKQVEALGGTIRVESQLGKGTSFTVCFRKFDASGQPGGL